ncbi:hypothetical protein CVCC1112_2634 [Paenarthrobacter nicotinovorans]|uniref:hypothetical protein n=1 Tax=Paenarthrobacter nicotinovorans TaxID=29320 RepID=UPI0007CC0762|nr:hypothetical protein [Paenarthrobacter nicotinovorans]GAT87975.1 hypothetical protein CVCC1112_2634 [Paenarthrobacter nicotinovorans]
MTTATEFSVHELASRDLRWINDAVASGYLTAQPISGDLSACDYRNNAMEVPC